MLAGSGSRVAVETLGSFLLYLTGVALGFEKRRAFATTVATACRSFFGYVHFLSVANCDSLLLRLGPHGLRCDVGGHISTARCSRLAVPMCAVPYHACLLYARVEFGSFFHSALQ